MEPTAASLPLRQSLPPPQLHLSDCNFPAWTVFLSQDWPEWTLAGSAGLDVY